LAATVYSTRFVNAQLTTTNTTYFTVPAGNVAVVRTMTAAWSAPANGQGVGQILLNGANSFVWFFPIQASELASALWNGRLVLPAGEIIRAAATGTAVTRLTVSGYLLTL
jgi:hypothetical protein